MLKTHKLIICAVSVLIIIAIIAGCFPGYYHLHSNKAGTVQDVFISKWHSKMIFAGGEFTVIMQGTGKGEIVVLTYMEKLEKHYLSLVYFTWLVSVEEYTELLHVITGKAIVLVGPTDK